MIYEKRSRLSRSKEFAPIATQNSTYDGYATLTFSDMTCSVTVYVDIDQSRVWFFINDILFASPAVGWLKNGVRWAVDCSDFGDRVEFVPIPNPIMPVTLAGSAS